MSLLGDAYGETLKEVVSYEDDVFVWVYMDQVDRVVRYEAYVVGYDDRGERTTLDFVLEEGVLDNVHEAPVLRDCLEKFERAAYGQNGDGPYTFTVDGKLVAPAALKYFYCVLTEAELERVHRYFADQEERLKIERRSRWTRMLKALGYDVIASL